MNKTKVIEVKDYRKVYKKSYVLDGASWSATQGSFHALLGSNGAGKTTMVKSIIGGFALYEGTIKVMGKDPVAHPEVFKEISYIPEVAIFPTNMNVTKYLFWIGMLKHNNKRIVENLVEELIGAFELTDFAKRNPNRLSSGQKKKIMLARIFIEDSSIVILDEPAANLDFEYRTFLFSTLQDLKAKGKTIIIISHIVAEISRFVDEATFVKDGSIIFNGKLAPGSLEKKYHELIGSGDKYV